VSDTLPPTLAEAAKGPALSIIPLGGIGEIGMNMTVLEYGDDLIVIDAGLMFPDAEMLGVDIVIPDFAYLIENRHKVRAVVLTMRTRTISARSPSC
jgi:ribonuclease J